MELCKSCGAILPVLIPWDRIVFGEYICAECQKMLLAAVDLELLRVTRHGMHLVTGAA